MEVNNFNWNTALTSILQSAGASDVSAAGKIDENGQLVVQITTKDGRVSTVTMDPPELDEAVRELTDAGKDALLARLSELCGENFGIEQVIGNPSVARLFFDMTQLMKLMQEVAQEQKKNAREMREASLQTELGAIQAQAYQQRAAAKSALICSIVSMAMQVGALVASTVISAKAAAKQGSELKESGLLDAQADLKLTSTSVNSAEFAHNNSVKAQGVLTQGEKATFNQYMEPTTTAEGKILTAQQRQENAQAQGAQPAQEDAVAAAKTEIADSLDKACAKVDADVDAARSDVARAQERLDTLEKSKNFSEADHQEAVQQLDGAKQRLASLENVQKAVHAKSFDMKHQYGLTESLQNDLSRAQAKVEAIDRGLTTSPEWRAAEKATRIANTINQVSGILKTTMDATSQMISAEQNARATEKTAVQKEAEAEYNELSDMMKTAQDTIAAVLQLYQAMIQAESQAVEQIIRA